MSDGIKTAEEIRAEKFEKFNAAEIAYWRDIVQPQIENSHYGMLIRQNGLPSHVDFFKLLKVGKSLGFDTDPKPGRYDPDSKNNSVFFFC